VKTKVFLTVDTEFSIGGAFADPVANRPVGPQAVLCEVGDKSEGLGFLLETFASHGMPATFFVEALNVSYFGDDPMCRLAATIVDAGHDVELHLHPCWTYFKNPGWRDTLRTNPPSDHMHSRTTEQLTTWMREGIETFRRWGIETPIALRTGSMMADRTVYGAMEAVGLTLASNIGLGMYRPEESGLHFYSGIQRVGSVVELCVTTYADIRVSGRTHLRSLTVTGSSRAETRALLDRAHEHGVPAVVLLTHPFEFVKYTRADFANLKRNRLNQSRLVGLCEFLGRNPERFEVTTFRAFHMANQMPAVSSNVVLDIPLPITLGRMVANRVNDIAWLP